MRRFGSGNTGTSNGYRHAGIVVGPVQFGQGFAPVLAARLVGLPTAITMLIALCTVIGNGWPGYLHVYGERG